MVKGLDESSVTGKRLFLECYRLAREEGLSIRNIRAGWKATGLWPVNISKPLISPLLMANNNAQDIISGPNTPYTPLEPMTTQGATLEDYGHTQGVISTPRKARELQRLLKAAGKDRITQRRLFQKVSKVYDEKDFDLAVAKRRIEELEAQIERIKPTRRRKVIPDPNSSFTDIRNIRRAQREAGRAIDSSTDSSLASVSNSKDEEMEDCIVAER